MLLYQSTPHVEVKASSCSSHSLLAVSSRMSSYIYTVYKYIVADTVTVLYLHALPIDYLFYSYSSLYLNYNLSQA